MLTIVFLAAGDFFVSGLDFVAGNAGLNGVGSFLSVPLRFLRVNPDRRTIRCCPVGGAFTTSIIPVTGGVLERLDDTSLQA